MDSICDERPLILCMLLVYSYFSMTDRYVSICFQWEWSHEVFAKSLLYMLTSAISIGLPA